MFQQPDLFASVDPVRQPPSDDLNLPALIERIADVSRRPRYAFMVLNLIAKAAGRNNGSAGPYVLVDGERIPLRDWLCDSLVPIAQRDARRLAIVDQVRSGLEAQKALPDDPQEAARVVQEEVDGVVGNPVDSLAVAILDVVVAVHT